MNSHETLEFAERLMQEVWLPLDAGAVPRFYQRDVVGYNRKQRLNYDDVVHRLVRDQPRYTDPHYDIQDIIAAEDKFAIRFAFTGKLLPSSRRQDRGVLAFGGHRVRLQG
jgi:hypothetical protein